MAAARSTMLPLGTTAPDFRLPDVVSGRIVTRDEHRDAPALLVTFICNHCPYVKHVLPELMHLGRDYGAKGVGIVAISSNDAAQLPQDGPDAMRAEATAHGFPFPYLYDESQAVARAFQAACTPEFYLFDTDRALAYRGRLDDSTPGSGIPVTGRELRAALDALLEGREAPAEQTPSIGCGIKWKPGLAPGY